MLKPELSRNDANSIQFGAIEAYNIFNAAASIPFSEEETGGRVAIERDLEALALDAVRTTIRFRDEAEEPFEDIDTEVAAEALVTRVLEELCR